MLVREAQALHQLPPGVGRARPRATARQRR
jgi:hypothetical protein